MAKPLDPTRVFLLCCVVSLTMSCGTPAQRQLQSITIQAVGNQGEVAYTATGIYNTEPRTVTPLPSSWSFQKPSEGYALTTEPYVVSCEGPGQVNAMAPADPQAPASGMISSTKMVVANAPVFCP